MNSINRQSTRLAREEADKIKEITAVDRAARRLTEHFDKTFTPYEVLVGTLGGVLAEETYCMDLLPPMTRPFDAVDYLGRMIRICCDQGETMSIDVDANVEMLLALRISANGTIEEIFNGPAAEVRELIDEAKADESGKVRIGHGKLRALMKSVPEIERVPLRTRELQSPN